MTRRKKAAPAAGATATAVDGGPVDPRLAGGTPPAQPRADQCVECGRGVNLADPVSHGLRGSHTCHTPAGVIPPYLDPTTDAERGALLTYQQRRAEQRRADLSLDPTRPF